MKRKTKKQANGAVWLDDNTLAATRMQAIEVAARLPEPEPGYGGMLGGQGGPGRPGKSADKVIVDAHKIMAFITKR
jgi:hypothetical protein